MKNKLFLILLAVISVIVFGCTQSTSDPVVGQGTPVNVQQDSGDVDWKEIEVKDVVTGETFKISDFKGKSIFVETMAVWCPLCTKQQIQLQQVHDRLGDSVVDISINTDSNENEDTLKRYAEAQGFKSLKFVIDPEGRIGKQLVEEFGFNSVNPPSTPVILIDKDFNARMLRFGIKSADELIAELDK